ncbi:MAG: tRNA pseudouridine(38-40) synthase TruA [Oscillospiraceae bacterium]|jgi:tRNA pseudouridine38-40 synthase|nr:tRNA pseudouridine(38-40) synthase TruA [Oscillospiraceae bacterium]
MRNLLVTICFDGANYHGWQVQQNAVSVQQVFQQALEKIMGEQPNIKGCSRTDSFVHAREFCISFHTEHGIPCERMVGALNHFLPKDIAVLSCREVPMDFHARYSCLGKEYEYQIWNERVRNPFLKGRALHYWYPLDLARLNRASSYLLGAHDFTSFCAVDARKRGNMTRTITQARWKKNGSTVSFFVSADGFLYHMVRILVGTMLRVAERKFEPEDLKRILKACDRAAAGPTAPPQGLYLNQVFYDHSSLNGNKIL